MIDSLGGCDAVVANAGVVDTIHRAERFSDEEWRKDLETNLYGAFYLVQAAFEALAASGDGRVVLISSVAAETGIPGQVAYGASKAGLVGMARTLAAEWASRGIRCNVVMPGFIATPKVRAMPAEVAERDRRARSRFSGSASPTSSPAPSASCSHRRRRTSRVRSCGSMGASACRFGSGLSICRELVRRRGDEQRTGEEVDMHPTIRRAIADHQIADARLAAQTPARIHREALSSAPRGASGLRRRRVLRGLAVTISRTRRGPSRLESEAR